MSERENINSEMLEEIERLRKELEKEKSLRIASENNQKIIQEHLSLTQEKLNESLEKNQT